MFVHFEDREAWLAELYRDHANENVRSKIARISQRNCPPLAGAELVSVTAAYVRDDDELVVRLQHHAWRNESESAADLASRFAEDLADEIRHIDNEIVIRGGEFRAE